MTEDYRQAESDDHADHKPDERRQRLDQSVMKSQRGECENQKYDQRINDHAPTISLPFWPSDSWKVQTNG